MRCFHTFFDVRKSRLLSRTTYDHRTVFSYYPTSASFMNRKPSNLAAIGVERMIRISRRSERNCYHWNYSNQQMAILSSERARKVQIQVWNEKYTALSFETARKEHSSGTEYRVRESRDHRWTLMLVQLSTPFSECHSVSWPLWVYCFHMFIGKTICTQQSAAINVKLYPH